MEHERIITRSTSCCANIAASRVESLRINEDMEKVMRVYEDGKLVDTLPGFSLSANVFDFFGKDYSGAAENDIFTFAGKEKVLVSKCTFHR